MDKKQIGTGAIISYIAIAVNVLVGLLYTPWMVNTIGQSQYGIFTLANSLITMFLIDFGLSSATARYVSNYHAEGDSRKVNGFLGVIYRLYIVIDVVIFVILTVIFVFIDKIYVNLTPDELYQFKVVYIIAASYSLISFPFLTLNGILTAYEKFIQLKLADLLYRLLTVVLMVVALSCGMGLYALVSVNAIAGLIVIAYKLTVIKRKTDVRPDLRYHAPNLFGDIFKFSVWVTVTSLASRLIFTITPSILGIVANSAAIAVFGIVSTIEGYVYSITTAINGMFMPTISKAYAESKEDLAKSVTPLFISVGKFNFALNTLLVVGFVVVGKEFIMLWMGETYLDAYWGILLVIIPGLFYNPLQVANTAMVVKNQVKYQAYISIIIGVVNVALSFMLSGTYGVIGASIAICVAYFVKLIAYFVVHSRIMKFDMRLFVKKCYVRMTPCLVIPLALGLIITNVLPSGTWLWFVAKVLIVTALFGASLLLCFGKDELKGILQYIGIKKGE